MPILSLLELPSEIILRIVESSPPPSLKALCQSCSALQKMAEPLLFHSVTIYPHMQRMEQVLNMSLQPRLRHYVKWLSYDNRYIGLVDFIIKKIESSYSVRVLAKQKTEMLDQARKFKKSTLEPGRDEDIELLFLHDIIRNFPNLESISCIESRAYGMEERNLDADNLPDIYANLRRMTCGSHPDYDLELGQYIFPKLKQTAARILVASARAPRGKVTSFTIRNGFWDSIMNFEPQGKHLSMLTPFIGNLQTLVISAECDDDTRRQFLMTNLATVLVLATSLRNLDLDFGHSVGDPYSSLEFDADFPATASIMEYLLPTQSPSSPTSWPERLESLSFGHLICSKSEFLRLLRKISLNVKKLALSNLLLLPESGSLHVKPQRSGCLVALIHDIKKHLRLESVHLSGIFSNDKAQSWNFVPRPKTVLPKPGTTAARLESFILHDSEDCPIDGLAIQANDQDIMENQLSENEHLNDDSFEISNHYFRIMEALDSIAGASDTMPFHVDQGPHLSTDEQVSSDEDRSGRSIEDAGW